MLSLGKMRRRQRVGCATVAEFISNKLDKCKQKAPWETVHAHIREV
jgi:hypothetical protein